MNCKKSYFYSPFSQIIHSFPDCLIYRTHSNDNSFSIFGTVIDKRCVISACFFGNLFHIVIYYIRYGFVKSVLSFPRLKIYIVILSRTSRYGSFGINRSLPELFYCLPVKKPVKNFVIYYFYFIYLMRSSETVEKMQHRNSRFDCRQVSYPRQIHYFLYRACRHHCPARHPYCINILMISKNRKCLSGYRPCSHMHNSGK